MDASTPTEDLTALGGLGLLVAPSTGRFRPEPTDALLSPGLVLGYITGGRGRADEVRCPVAARLQGLLAGPGQPVRKGQAVAWIQIPEQGPEQGEGLG